MDFHSLSRRDLQFFCKRNNIPANMTNLAMADALQALETVEGIDEFANQSETNASETPMARSTRGSRIPASSKKDESSVQRVYSTRRSVKLLEQSMADLSLKTNVPAKTKIEREGSVISEETKEAEEVVSVRDLNASLEKECDDVSKDDIVEEQETSVEDASVVVDHAASDIVEESVFEQVKNDSVVVDETDKGALESEVTAGDKVDSVTTVSIADDESKELSESESDEWSDFEIDEEALVSDKQTESEKNKENVGEEEMVLNKNEERSSEAEAMETEKTKKPKKKIVDEESFKDTSVRQLTKMIKELEVKNKEQQQH